MSLTRLLVNLSTKLKTKMSSGSAVAEQIVRNQQLLYNKLGALVSWTEAQPSRDAQSASTVTSEQIVAEQQRLTAENAALREQISTLVKKLTDLEIYVKGKEFVAPIHLLTQSSPETPKVVEQAIKAQPVAQPEKKAEPASKASKKEAKVEKKKDSQENKENKPKNVEQKQETKQQPKAAAAAAVPEQPITAARLDLRVGKIVDVKKHPDADSLYVEQIECGEEKPRTVVSGLVKFVPIEEMKDRLVIVLCNLKPAKMRGVTSEAMVMCASTPEKVEILTPPPGAVPGDRVTFKNHPGQPDGQLNPKKKIWEQIAPDLGTDGNLVANYKGDPFVVEGKGEVKSQTLKNVIVK